MIAIEKSCFNVSILRVLKKSGYFDSIRVQVERSILGKTKDFGLWLELDCCCLKIVKAVAKEGAWG